VFFSVKAKDGQETANCLCVYASHSEQHFNMSTEDPFRGVELLDFLRNEDGATSNLTSAAVAKPPALQLSISVDFDMFGPPELNTSALPYPRNITKAPTWEIAVKVH